MNKYLSQSLLAAVKPHHPFVDTHAYVASSDVSLAGTFVLTFAYFMFCRETLVSLVVPLGLRRLA